MIREINEKEKEMEERTNNMDKLNIKVNIEVENSTEVKEELTQINDLLIEVKNRLESINQKELNLKISK